MKASIMEEINDIPTNRAAIADTQLKLLCQWADEFKEVVYQQLDITYGHPHGFEEDTPDNETNL